MAPREGAEGAGRAAPGAGGRPGGEGVGTREGSRRRAAALRSPPRPRRPPSGADAPPGGAGRGRWEGSGVPFLALHPFGLGRPPTCAREGPSWLAEKGSPWLLSSLPLSITLASG